MFRLLSRVCYLVVAALILMIGPAHATTVMYLDPVAWQAAVNGTTSIGFEGLAPANSFMDYSTSTGLVINGVDFIGNHNLSQYQLQVVDSGLASPFYNWGTGAGLRGPTYDVSGFTPFIHIILPANVTAFSVDLMSGSPNGVTYTVTMSTGDTSTVATANRPTQTFYGVTSTTAISYVDLALVGTVNTNASYILVDNFQFGSAADQSAAETPELCTFALIGTGLAMFGYLGKRWRILATVPA